MRILKRNNQFGRKAGISTLYAIIEIVQYIEHANIGAKILIMGLSMAFGAINRTILRMTLYKKGLPGETIKHIRRGHRGKN